MLLFFGASWFDYRATFTEAKQDLDHVSRVGREHAEKVFDGQSQVVERVADLVRGMDEPTIIRSEAPLHDGFARIVAHLGEVQSVLLASTDGRPLVSAGTYPVPIVDLSKRDYFRAVSAGYPGPYVSSLQVGDVNRQLFFGLARPWIGPDGRLAGVIDVAVSPTFFQDFYAALLDHGADTVEGNVVTLVRNDGQLLVRYPPIVGPPPIAAPRSAFLRAIEANPDEGIYESHSIVDHNQPERIFAYHRVNGYPLYVVAGRERAVIVDGWRRRMGSHLVFGVPAAVALFAVTWTALVRARREEAALIRATQENTKRREAEDALLRAQRLEAVGQMTGGVAHDFNNLLTIIMGGANLLARRAEDPATVTRVAEQIGLAAKRGGEVTQQLLAFSRRQFVQPETINLNRQLVEFEPLLRRAAREAVQVDLDLERGLDPVRLDPGHFEAAILNLVGNARDAMPDGGRVLITTRNIELATEVPSDLPAGAYVRIAVSDTGAGMDAKTVAKAFEPFFTTKETGKGSGLGLSQVYGFAKQAGGDVRIDSAPGKGTTVEILLPCAIDREFREQAADETTPPRNASKGEVILVVEDEPALLEMTAGNLHDLGYTTLTTTSAKEAMDVLRSDRRIDVLFSDVVMPGGVNGLQLSVEARRLRPGLKVLLTSGYAAGLEGSDGGGVPLLTKPYDRGQLGRQMRAVLQG